MSHVLHRSFSTNLKTAVGGEGVYLIDSEGKRYLDGSGGAGVSCLGHNHPAIRQAIHEQLDKLEAVHTSFFTTDPAEKLATHLIERWPSGKGRVHFCSGGSEATETAVKLALQYFREIGDDKRWRIISRKQSYHGNTLYALSLGDNPARQKNFAPLLAEIAQFPACYSYRHRRLEESEEAYGLRAANELEKTLQGVGADTVAAVLLETVGGATSGCLAPPPGYLKRIRQICDRHGILLILDEVMSGMGRTGYLFACEEDGVAPDLLTCAKGLGGGYQPIGAVLASEKIVKAIEQGSGQVWHGFTYVGHALAAAGALAVQQTVEREGLLQKVRDKGAELRQKLEERFGNHHHIGEIRGRGLFLAIELVADRASKQPFDPALKLNAKIKANALKEGLLCYPSGGAVDGVAGDHVLLAPPFIISSAEIDELVEKLDRAIAASLP